MKKIIIFLIAVFAVINLNAQTKYYTKSGHIWFYGETKFEVIEAHNNQVATIINIKTGEIAFDMLMKAFKFEKALMEEHFNENYNESSKYPKCTFKGKILNYDEGMLSKDGKQKVTVEGDMTFHGVTKKVKAEGTLEKKDGKVYAKAIFKVKPEDFGIEIPGVVRDKIAEKMDVTVDIVYDKSK